MGKRAAIIGRCKLCLSDGVELQDSHVLPKALYRNLRNSTRNANPNPVLVTRTVEVQTSWQPKERLFCSKCEQRISERGERWMFANGLRPDGTHKLAAALSSVEGMRLPGQKTILYYAKLIPSVSVSAISYFAASVFWRSSVHAWKDQSDAQVRLGPFEESFRAYLNGESGFPLQASLSVWVRTPSRVSNLFQFPSAVRLDGLRGYAFTMPGIVFHLYASRNLPPNLLSTCFVHGAGHPIFVSSALEEGIFKRATSALDAVDKRLD